MIETLVHDLSGIPETEAVLLGGSRASERSDNASDYDLYVYVSTEIEPGVRRRVLDRHMPYLELDNRFWETEDDGVLSSGIPVDVVYRNLEDTERHLHGLLHEFKASTGYSTAVWANVIGSKILFDRNGKAAELKRRFDVPYPAGLKNAVIAKNLPLLRGHLPSYDAQIRKALERRDAVSVNHRIAAYLASYFDILFAFNGIPHPGEKRTVEILTEKAALLPAGMASDVAFLLDSPTSDAGRIMGTLDRLTDGLESILGNEKHGRER